jgi:hypothetical protein
MKINTTSRTCKTLSACCLAVLLSVLPSPGAIITVVNGDFSSPELPTNGLSNGIAGWNRDVTGSITFGGTARIGSEAEGSYPGIALGNQIGYNSWNAGILGTVSYTQVLSASLENNTLYTINLDVALSMAYPLPTYTDGYSDDPGVNNIVVRLLAGGQVFGTFDSSLSVVAGALSPWTITQQSSANEALAGQELTIEILVRKDTPDTIQFALDNISVDAQPIPEPGTAGMMVAALGAGILVKTRRKRGLQ